MEIKKGIPVSPGIGITQAFVLDSEEFRIPERLIESDQVENEQARFRKAVEASEEEIRQLQLASRDLGSEVDQIFDAHVKILQDPAIVNEVTKLIAKACFTAEYATSRVLRRWIKVFRNIQDSYFSQRYSDICDIERRLLRNLLGEKREELTNLTEEVIIIAHDLTPGQTAQLDRLLVRGFATDSGGQTGHTGIVARTLGIPAVVGLETITADVSGGDTVIIDGNRGVVIVDPDEMTLERYREMQNRHRLRVEALSRQRTLPAETLDGYEVSLLANIELTSEVRLAVDAGAEGIGLYRTEFIYTLHEAPDETDHLREYRKALQWLDGRPLTIRTLDFGADKFFEETDAQFEKNPFLGCRSIRLCFERLDIFRTQLRAIYRASAEGDVRLLLPMISNVEELRRAKIILQDVREELQGEGLPFDEQTPIGVMIEIPSAALITDILAQEVDFFSIGTNDLIQYGLAVDRVNERVAPLYQPAHPAILRLIRGVLEEGRKTGVDVAICGEMSGEVVYTLLLLGMGLREFSISPGSIPEIKKIIRSTTIYEARLIAEQALSLEDANQALDYLSAETRRILPDLVLN